MHKQSRHIAALLLGIFLLGTVLVPAVHQIGHALEALHPAPASHVHPDYESLLDGDHHQLDTHLDCIVCNGPNVNFLSVATYSPLLPYRLHAGNIESDFRIYSDSIRVCPVRGPPLV